MAEHYAYLIKERVLDAEGTTEFVLYRTRSYAGWFRKVWAYERMRAYPSKPEAEKAMRQYIDYPYTRNSHYYDAQGVEDTSW